MAELHVRTTSLLALCLCCCLLPGAFPQPSDGSQYPPYPRFNPSMAVIIAVLIAALFFMAFFSIYIRHCSEPLSSPSAVGNRRASAAAAASRGLDPAVVATFPTFVYANVKGLKLGKGALECAVCLNEFEDDETLRLIPKCDHVFHPDCIDAWLASHVTCPVCRANLVPHPGDPANSVTELVAELESRPTADHEVDGSGGSDLESGRLRPEASDQNPSVLAPDNAADDKTKPKNGSNSGSNLVNDGRLNRNRTRGSSRSSRRSRWLIFPRSHSTGHSLVQPGEDTERYTLRLPVEVRKRMLDRQLNRAMSMVLLPRGGSSRIGGSTRIVRDDSIGRGKHVRGASSRSDRWFFGIRTPQLFSRAASVRSPRVAAVSEERTTGSATQAEEAEGKANNDMSRPPV
ncbi:hypothetical protein MLD38_020647 [Melastoma candidum]|uniref:Uncharacterized protein n=1 Tax=Melastoma candidum TaxID=119954 RepID=A0ACB9QD51_9MYRT|nr:hypothetical protein MLD38_020647 [Melastoma candidum]